MISKKLNELATKNIKSKLNDHLSPVLSIYYDEEKRLMVSGSSGGIVKVWNTDNEENLTCKKTLKVPNGSSS